MAITWSQTTIDMDEKLYFRGADGAELAYRRWAPAQPKRSTPVVLLHGAASNSTRWWHFVEHSRLTADRLLFRPDLRGNGESIWRGPARIEHWSQDIAEMLRHERQTEVFIVGHCLGANIALDFASRYPGICAGLVLVEPIAHESVTGILARLKTFLPVLRLSVKLIRLLNQLGFYRHRLENMDLRDLDRRVHEASGKALKKALKNHGSPWHDIKVTPTAQYLGNFVEILRPLPVSGVHCPCLVIQSSGQSITDPERTQTVLNALTEVEFIRIESEHWIPATQPDRLCELVDTWILKNRIDTEYPSVPVKAE
ncbi:MAG: alpha/beta hydrolase [Pseudomonadota bacterium]